MRIGLSLTGREGASVPEAPRATEPYVTAHIHPKRKVVLFLLPPPLPPLLPCLQPASCCAWLSSTSSRTTSFFHKLIWLTETPKTYVWLTARGCEEHQTQHRRAREGHDPRKPPPRAAATCGVGQHSSALCMKPCSKVRQCTGCVTSPVLPETIKFLDSERRSREVLREVTQTLEYHQSWEQAY